jgi:hypothetical protein
LVYTVEDSKEGQIQNQACRRNQTLHKQRVSGDLEEKISGRLIELDYPNSAARFKLPGV